MRRRDGSHVINGYLRMSIIVIIAMGFIFVTSGLIMGDGITCLLEEFSWAGLLELFMGIAGIITSLVVTWLAIKSESRLVISDEKVKSTTISGKELCTVDMKETVYYTTVPRGRRGLSLLISNEEFIDDEITRCKPDPSKIIEINDFAFIPIFKNWPKREWKKANYLPDKTDDFEFFQDYMKFMGVLVAIGVIFLFWKGLHPIDYKGMDIETETIVLYTEYDNCEEYDIIYYKPESTRIVAWVQEDYIPKSTGIREKDLDTWFDDQYAGITHLPFAEDEIIEEDNYYIAILTMDNLKNPNDVMHLNQTFFVTDNRSRYAFTGEIDLESVMYYDRAESTVIEEEDWKKLDLHFLSEKQMMELEHPSSTLKKVGSLIY